MKGRCAGVLTCILLAEPGMAHPAVRASETRTSALMEKAAPEQNAQQTRVAAKNQVATKPAKKPRTTKKSAKRRVKLAAVPVKGPAARPGYTKVSELVNFPSFFPGIGTLYVKPATLPHGPFLAFDRSDRLVSTIYMVPMKDMEDRKLLDALAGFSGRGDHVTMHYNSGHPGVDVPHYHIVIWHVSKKDEARVAK